jgi:hypothetical protein
MTRLFECFWIIPILLCTVVGCDARPEPKSESEIEITQTPTHTAAISATSLPTPTKLKITEEELFELTQDGLLGKLKGVDFDQDKGTIFVRWDLQEDYSNERISNNAKKDTVTILKSVYQSEAVFNEVIISGWYTWTVDINNTLEYAEFINLRYDYDTLENINWETVRYKFIWLIAKGGEVHWLLDE